jgi:tetratricopeptide (TPR) repeat protein
MPDPLPAPRHYKGVMISSTFTDLEAHRAALIKAIKGQSLTDVAMENDSALADLDVIDSSLKMVADSSAYIGIISRKYGQVPKCRRRNPGNVSLTELEFNEAQRLNRPILLFIMGEKHPLIEADFETSANKRKKLAEFRERAKIKEQGSSVHRVYAEFDSLEEFTQKAIHSVANLRRYLDDQEDSTDHEPTLILSLEVGEEVVPTPPDFYAEPPYIGSHEFLGRKAELERLDDWAKPADSHPIILFEAIGGTGKSLLTWEWTTNHAVDVRDEWAGRFWYSFYEKGAIMADFCRRAVAYITGQPLKSLRKKKTVELADMLLRHLQEEPWLFVLDGLERVLVAYHRFDAAQVVDEEAGRSDQIVHRDPRSAIRPEDDDLLRSLAAASPSKLIISSRLVPRALLNQAGQPIPGVARVLLPGLRPADAEALIRACGVKGNSTEIQNYLTRHCDCHPLVTGVLAGLINDYLPDRGNFDAWADDPSYGGQLNLADLDLVQKRNHILKAALDALPEKSSQLLSTLALISEAVDYPTLSAFNPHVPPEPPEVEVPTPPETQWRWQYSSRKEKEEAREEYKDALERREAYERAVDSRLHAPEFSAASHKLNETVRDLERRGFLQYDAQAKRYDLHPVVRGIAAGGLDQAQRQQYGQRVVDHFSSQTHDPYEQAETLADLRNGLHIVRTLLQMGRYEQAFENYGGDLAQAMVFNLEAHAEVLSVIRPFFSQGWDILQSSLRDATRSYLLNSAAVSLSRIGETKEAVRVYGSALITYLRRKEWSAVRTLLTNISSVLRVDSLSKLNRYSLLELDIAGFIDGEGPLFAARLTRFDFLDRVGRYTEAEVLWSVLDSMGRSWPRFIYLPGEAELWYAWFRFHEGSLSEELLARAEELTRTGKYRIGVRSLHQLRGQWHLRHGRWLLAADSLSEAVQMARAVGQNDPASETWLTVAKFHLGWLSNARQEAEQLAAAKSKNHQALGELWLAIGDAVQAEEHALEAYKEAWGDGEPYVYRYALNKARDLLHQLGADIPHLPPYDPAKDEKLPWEDELVAAIEKLREEKEAEKESKTDDEE